MRVATSIAAVLGAAVCLAAAAACGDVSADLFAVTRSGTVPGASFVMVLRDDGTVTCDGQRRMLPPELLIKARGLQADLEIPAAAGTRLASGPRPVFTYVIATPGGRLSFSDESPHQPPAFYQVALLTSQVARQVCRLPR